MDCVIICVGLLMPASDELQVDSSTRAGELRGPGGRLEPETGGWRRRRRNCRLRAKYAVRAMKASPHTGLDEEGGGHRILGADEPHLCLQLTNTVRGKRCRRKNILQNSTTRSHMASMEIC